MEDGGSTDAPERDEVSQTMCFPPGSICQPSLTVSLAILYRFAVFDVNGELRPDTLQR